MSEQIVQNCLIDTCVLQYALLGTERTKHLPSATTKLITASSDLLNHLKRIRISAITWAEIHRNLRAPDERMLKWFQDKVLVIPVTEETARLSARLLIVKTGQSNTCPRCLNSMQTTPCAKCHAKLPKSSHLPDALILATAELRKDIDVLYTTDGGFDFYKTNSLVQNCEIRRPPNPNGPLFERVAQTENASP